MGDGAEFILPGDTHYFGFLSGVHERHITNLIHKVVNSGDVCIDVGANIGYFATMMAARCGTSGQVLAFEPVPETFAYLARNARLAETKCQQIIPMQQALSAKIGSLSLVRHSHSTLNEVRIPSTPTDFITDPNHVESTTLDHVINERQLNSISLVKIDVEGHEWPVIEGGIRSLERGLINNLVIEITPGGDAKRIEDVLRPLASSTRCWIDNTWEEQPISSIKCRTDVWLTFNHKTTTEI